MKMTTLNRVKKEFEDQTKIRLVGFIGGFIRASVLPEPEGSEAVQDLVNAFAEGNSKLLASHLDKQKEELIEEMIKLCPELKRKLYWKKQSQIQSGKMSKLLHERKE